MSWVVRCGSRWRLHSLQWRGRAGRTTWGRRQVGEQGREGVLQTVIGAHGAFGDLLSETLNDIAALAKSRPRPGPAVVLADWNVD